MEGVGDQSLRNLESGLTPPGNIRASAMLEIIRVYYPDVHVYHFGGSDDLHIVPVNLEARRRLKGYVV